VRDRVVVRLADEEHVRAVERVDDGLERDGLPLRVEGAVVRRGGALRGGELCGEPGEK
jgi:hypothetical protein